MLENIFRAKRKTTFKYPPFIRTTLSESRGRGTHSNLCTVPHPNPLPQGGGGRRPGEGGMRNIMSHRQHGNLTSIPYQRTGATVDSIFPLLR